MAADPRSKSAGGSSRKPAPGSFGVLVPQDVLAGQPDIPLNRPVTTVGSNENARLHLVSRTVSKGHAIFVNSGGITYVADLASRTGVLVNGKLVRDIDLKTGDRIQIGKFLFKYRAPSNAPVPPAVMPPLASVIVVGLPAKSIETRVFQIGRRESNDIAFPNDAAVSTAHAVIFEMDGRWHIRDLGSRTGTLVGGKPIHQQALAFGDRIVIGESTLLFQPGVPVEEPEPPQAEPQPHPPSQIAAAANVPEETELPMAMEPAPVPIAATITESVSVEPPIPAEPVDEPALEAVEEPIPAEPPWAVPESHGAESHGAESHGAEPLSTGTDEIPLPEAAPNAEEIEAVPATAEPPMPADQSADALPVESAPIAQTTVQSAIAASRAAPPPPAPDDDFVYVPAEEPVDPDAVPDVIFWGDPELDSAAEQAVVQPVPPATPPAVPQVPRDSKFAAPAAPLAKVSPAPAEKAEAESIAVATLPPVVELAPAAAVEPVVISPKPAGPDVHSTLSLPEVEPVTHPMEAAAPDLISIGSVEHPAVRPAAGDVIALTEIHAELPEKSSTAPVSFPAMVDPLVDPAEPPVQAITPLGTVTYTATHATNVSDVVEPIHVAAIDDLMREPAIAGMAGIDQSVGVLEIEPPAVETPASRFESVALNPVTHRFADAPMDTAIEPPADIHVGPVPHRVLDSVLLPEIEPDGNGSVLTNSAPVSLGKPVVGTTVNAAGAATRSLLHATGEIVADSSVNFSAPAVLAPVETVAHIAGASFSAVAAVVATQTVKSGLHESPTTAAETLHPATVAEWATPEIETRAAPDPVASIPPDLTAFSDTPADAAIADDPQPALGHLTDFVAEQENGVLTDRPEESISAIPELVAGAETITDSTATIVTPEVLAPVATIAHVAAAHMTTAQPGAISAVVVGGAGEPIFEDSRAPESSVATSVTTQDIAADLEPTEIPHPAADANAGHRAIESPGETHDDQTHHDQTRDTWDVASTEPIAESDFAVHAPVPDVSLPPDLLAFADASLNTAAVYEPQTSVSSMQLEDAADSLDTLPNKHSETLSEVPVAEEIGILSESLPRFIEVMPEAPVELTSELREFEPVPIPDADLDFSDLVNDSSLTHSPAPVELSGVSTVDEIPSTPLLVQPDELTPPSLVESDEPSGFETASDVSIPQSQTAEADVSSDLDFLEFVDEAPPAPGKPLESLTETSAAQIPPAQTADQPAVDSPAPDLSAGDALAGNKSAGPARGPSIFGFQFEGGSFLGGMPIALAGKAVAPPSPAAAPSAAPATPVSPVFDSRAKAPAGLGEMRVAPAVQQPVQPPELPRPAARPTTPPRPSVGRPDAPVGPTPLSGLVSEAHAPWAVTPVIPRTSRKPLPTPRPGAPAQKGLTSNFVPTGGTVKTADVFSQMAAPIGVEVFGGTPGDPNQFIVPDTQKNAQAGDESPAQLAAQSAAPFAPALTDPAAAPVIPVPVAKKKRWSRLPFLLPMLVLVPAALSAVIYQYVPVSAAVVGSLEFSDLPIQQPVDAAAFRRGQEALIYSEEVRIAAQAILERQGLPDGFTHEQSDYEEIVNAASLGWDQQKAFQLTYHTTNAKAGQQQVGAVLTALAQRDRDLDVLKNHAREDAALADAVKDKSAALIESIKEKRRELQAKVDAAPATEMVTQADSDAATLKQVWLDAQAMRVNTEKALADLRGQDPSKPIDIEADPEVIALKKQLQPLVDQIARLKGVGAIDAASKATVGTDVALGATTQPDADSPANPLLIPLQQQADDLQGKLDRRRGELAEEAALGPDQRAINQSRAVENLSVKITSLQKAENQAKIAADDAIAKARTLHEQAAIADAAKAQGEDLINQQTEAEQQHQRDINDSENKEAALAKCITAAGDPQVTIAGKTDLRPRFAMGLSTAAEFFLVLMILGELRRPKFITGVAPATALPAALPTKLVPWPQPRQLQGLDAAPATSEQSQEMLGV